MADWAKCPYCTDGCGRCDRGRVVITMAAGQLYTRACVNPACAFENGGYILQPGKTLPYDQYEPGPCVECGQQTEWKHVAEV